MATDSILVVDDVVANIRVLVDLLGEAGYKVSVAKTGETALGIALAAIPDLILLDVMLPGIDGFETCRRLKAEEATQEIPILFMTALTDPNNKVKGFDAGAVDYITKPIEQAEALARIKVHLQLRRARAKLIEDEKMAALGHLIAGIAHEINSPLGAIQASISNVTAALQQTLQELPSLFQSLPPERLVEFQRLLNVTSQPHNPLSFREERQLKRQLSQTLETWGIADADTRAETLSRLGLTTDLSPWQNLLLSEQCPGILAATDNLAVIQRNSQNIRLAVERAARIVFALKSYTRQDQTQEPVNISLIDGIETVLTIYQNQIKRGVEVQKTYEAQPQLWGYPEALIQVWTNLIQNALQAMNYKGELGITVSQAAEQITVLIRDSGPGIPLELQTQIFNPFFTTKPRGEGSGLGLSIVCQIIAKHQGQVVCRSQPGTTEFEVTLPIDLRSRTLTNPGILDTKSDRGEGTVW